MSEQLPAEVEPERPWEQPGAVRRDCAPHRAGLIAGLGLAAWATSVLGGLCFVLLPLTAPLALAPGAAAWALGRRDVGAIDAGRMDPAGRGPTEYGLQSGRTAILIMLLAVAGWAALFALSALARVVSSAARLGGSAA
jgi:hypothetical protein